MSQNETPKPRSMQDMPHEYLVESVQLLERYTATMLQMILDHHPYMAPAANSIGTKFQAEYSEIEAKYPRTDIILPPAGLTIVKPH